MHRRAKHNRAQELAGKARDTLGPAAEQAKDKLGPQIEHARKQARKDIKKARKQMQPHIKQARKNMEPHLKEARKQVEPRVQHAREVIQPYVDEATTRIGPYVEQAKESAEKTWIPAAEEAAHKDQERFKDDVVPAVSAALATAAAASEPYREEARRRGAATLAAVKGEVEPPKKSHKLRNLLVLLGLGGIAFFVAKRLTESEDSAWQTSYEPTPAPPPTTPPRPTVVPDPENHDAGAAGPDEALADAGESPHTPTDPDAPLENRNLS